MSEDYKEVIEKGKNWFFLILQKESRFDVKISPQNQPPYFNPVSQILKIFQGFLMKVLSILKLCPEFE